MDGDAGAPAGHGEPATARFGLFAVVLMGALPFLQPPRLDVGEGRRRPRPDACGRLTPPPSHLC